MPPLLLDCPLLSLQWCSPDQRPALARGRSSLWMCAAPEPRAKQGHAAEVPTVTHSHSLSPWWNSRLAATITATSPAAPKSGLRLRPYRDSWRSSAADLDQTTLHQLDLKGGAVGMPCGDAIFGVVVAGRGAGMRWPLVPAARRQ
jgi:hypothetical protein